MASVAITTDYLEDALKNKTIVPSWRSLYTRLTAPPPSSSPANTTVSRIASFLLSPTALAALANPHNPFPTATPQSRQAFDKLISAATPANDQSTEKSLSTLPPIAELKDAALKLSKDLEVDEVTALRIVLLEHQERTRKGLLTAQGGEGEFNTGPTEMEKTFRMTVKDEDPRKKENDIVMSQIDVYLEERRYVVKVLTEMCRAAMSGAEDNVWAETGRQVMEECVMKQGGMLAKLVEGIKKRWTTGKNESAAWINVMSAFEEPEKLAFGGEKQMMLEVIHLLQLLFLQLYRPWEEITGQFVVSWFELMRETQYLAVRSNPIIAENLNLSNLKDYSICLVAVVSVAVLQCTRCDRLLSQELEGLVSPESSATPPANTPEPSRVSDKAFYLRDGKAIQTINSCIEDTASNMAAGPATMTWAMIVNGMSDLTYASDQTWNEADMNQRHSPAIELYKQLLPEMFPRTTQVGLKELASASANNMLRVFSYISGSIDPASGTTSTNGFRLRLEEDGWRMRSVLSYSVRRVQGVMSFSTQLMVATILGHDVAYDEMAEFQRYLQDDRPTQQESTPLDVQLSEANNWTGNPALRFWSDERSMTLMEKCTHRFPHEPKPLLELIRSLATENSRTLDYVTNLESFTATSSPGYYQYIDDTIVELVEDMPLVQARDGGIFSGDSIGLSAGAVILPAGTRGFVISGSGAETVVRWEYNYNVLQFLGRMLECALSNDARNGVFLHECGFDTLQVITEIISLFTMLVQTSPEAVASGMRPGQYELPQVLGDASEMVGQNKDVISIIFDLLDDGLNRTTTSEAFLIAGIQFVTSLIHIIPGRVWPYLARSALLERHGRGGALGKILSSVEVVKGDYSFTLTCLDLYERAVEEAVRSSALHKGKSRGIVLSKHTPQTHSNGLGVSEVVQKDILLGFTRTAVDIWEGFWNFKYMDEYQKTDIGTRLARIFTAILGYVYGVDGEAKGEEKLTGVLASSVEHLVNVFLGESGSEMAFMPIFSVMAHGVQTPENSLYVKSLRRWIAHTIEVVQFADMLVRVRLLTEIPPSQFEIHLYRGSAALTKLYGAHERYKQCVLELLETMVKAAGLFSEEEPPSLLGFLGSTCANHFVTMLATVDKPYQDVTIETRIWEFVSAVVSNKQQGMSILLLRGETLRQGNNATMRPVKSRSMLSVCLEGLEEIGRLPVEKTLAMLEMVSMAQNFWSLAMDDLGKHPKFLSTITKHVETVMVEFLPADSVEIMTQKAYTIAIAGHIARILALYFHARRPSEKDQEFFKQLLPRLNFYFERAVKVSGYRRSLHTQLAKNFEEKWGGVKLSQIKKTRLRRQEYGVDAIFDVELGTKVLGFDPSWNGARSDGYKKEVETANVNLSIVQTQVDLLHSWELLAMELCQFAPTSPDLRKSLLKVVTVCLEENISTGLPNHVFSQIVTRRSEFAFTVVSKLYTALPRDLDLADVFAVAWKVINTSETNFHHALQSAQMDYYRPILRIIYLCLLSSSHSPQHSTEFNFQILDLLNTVVALGFKDLVTAAHQHPTLSSPQDLALITAILQASQQLHGIDDLHTSLQNHLANADTITTATTLFSWSDSLPGGTTDPVYGELAALFLLELSAIPGVAEQLASENTLDHITSTSLASRLSTSPDLDFTSRAHAIWSRALLPLALNLLATIGPNIGREVMAFLRFFAPLLKLTVESWRKPHVVVRRMVEEAVTVATVWAVVRRMGGREELERLKKERGVEVEVMESGVNHLLGHRNYLKTLVVEEGEMEKIVAGLETVAGLLAGEEEE